MVPDLTPQGVQGCLLHVVLFRRPRSTKHLWPSFLRLGIVAVRQGSATVNDQRTSLNLVLTERNLRCFNIYWRRSDQKRNPHATTMCRTMSPSGVWLSVGSMLSLIATGCRPLWRGVLVSIAETFWDAVTVVISPFTSESVRDVGELLSQTPVNLYIGTWITC